MTTFRNDGGIEPERCAPPNEHRFRASRERIVELIGRILARHWLRARAEPQKDRPGLPPESSPRNKLSRND